MSAVVESPEEERDSDGFTIPKWIDEGEAAYLREKIRQAHDNLSKEKKEKDLAAATLNTYLQNLSERLSKADVRNRELEATLEEEKEKAKEMGNRLEAEKTRALELSKELEAEKTRLSGEFHDEKMKALSLTKELDAEKAKSAALWRMFETEKAKVEELEVQLGSEREKCSRANTRVEIKEKQLVRLQEMLDAKAAEHETLRKRQKEEKAVRAKLEADREADRQKSVWTEAQALVKKMSESMATTMATGTADKEESLVAEEKPPLPDTSVQMDVKDVITVSSDEDEPKGSEGTGTAAASSTVKFGWKKTSKRVVSVDKDSAVSLPKRKKGARGEDRSRSRSSSRGRSRSRSRKSRSRNKSKSTSRSESRSRSRSRSRRSRSKSSSDESRSRSRRRSRSSSRLRCSKSASRSRSRGRRSRSTGRRHQPVVNRLVFKNVPEPKSHRDEADEFHTVADLLPTEVDLARSDLRSLYRVGPSKPHVPSWRRFLLADFRSGERAAEVLRLCRGRRLGRCGFVTVEEWMPGVKR